MANENVHPSVFKIDIVKEVSTILTFELNNLYSFKIKHKSKPCKNYNKMVYRDNLLQCFETNEV